MSTSTPAPAQEERRVTAAFNVLRVLDRPTSTGREVADAMEQDPGLSKQILKMARSPLCGIRSTDLTVARAVVLLGFVTVRKLVVVSLCRELGSLDQHDEGRWRQALWIGIAAEEITRRIDETLASEALMMGMTDFLGDSFTAHGAPQIVEPHPEIDGERMARFLRGAERVADVIVAARPGLPSTTQVDDALEAAGLMPMEDGKLAVDIRRGYELYASLIA